METNYYHHKLTNYLDKLITEEKLQNSDGHEKSEIKYEDKDELILIEKLERDNYITLINSTGKYKATVDGRLFSENGGYVKRKFIETWTTRAKVANVCLVGLIGLTSLIYYIHEMRQSPSPRNIIHLHRQVVCKCNQ